MTAERFWKVVGGRKMFNGYIAFVALTAMAPLLKASFEAYAFGVLGALGLTSAAVAYEDRQTRTPHLKRRASDAVAPTSEEK